MKKTLSIVLLASFCLILSGCVFSIGGGHRCKKSNICAKHLNSDPELTEIQVVSRLTSEISRTEVYLAIAQRPGLSPKARAFLADEATKHLTSGISRTKVLLTLANNTGPAVEKDQQ